MERANSNVCGIKEGCVGLRKWKRLCIKCRVNQVDLKKKLVRKHRTIFTVEEIMKSESQ